MSPLQHPERRALAAAITSIGLVPVALVSVAEAQDDPGADRTASFQAVEGPSTEQVPGGPLLVGAYGVVFSLVLLYVLWIVRVQAATARDLERVRRAVEKSDRQPPAS